MTEEDLLKVKKEVLRRYPISAGVALEGIDIEFNKSVSTAAVVAKKNDKGILEVEKIKVNPDFFASLTFSQRVFVIAHEACHITLKHFARSLNKPVKDANRKFEEYCEKEKDETKRQIMKNKLHKKYSQIWNIATDACINAFLKKDGFNFPEDAIDPQTGEKMQFVFMEDGYHKSAEKIYDYLVKKDEEKEEKKSNQEKSNNSNQSGRSSGNIDDIDVDNYTGFDSHEEWTDGESEEIENSDEISEDEVFSKEIESRSKKNSKFKDTKESFSKLRQGANLDKIIRVEPVISWKANLVGSLEKTEEVWGNRRSSRFNPNARIEERTYETAPQVEVLLDTSGSISSSLLKGFLLQLYPLFESLYGEETKLKVGCFGTIFSGFTEIRSKEDIMNYVPVSGGGTDFELAATSFTKDPGRKITKIVFTDGYLGTPQVTRVDNIIWLVFGKSANFKPVGGRIIQISDKEYDNMINETQKFISEKESIKRM